MSGWAWSPTVRRMLKACLNGPRLPSEHPRLPVTAAALAADAVAVQRAGANAVHVHVKDPSGHDTLAAEPLAETLRAIREAPDGLPVGVTTGAWAAADPARRTAAVRGWTARPDFASVNWHESGADDVAGALLDQGIGVEAGLWTPEAVAAWLRSPLRRHCLRVLLELRDSPDEAGMLQLADRMLDQLAAAHVDLPVLLHGEGV